MYKEREVQNLQTRVAELERQLAEAQAAILRLTLPKEDKLQADNVRKCARRSEGNQENFIASEEKFRQAILVAPYPLMIRQDDGRVVMINAAWTEITGYTLEDIPTITEWTQKAYGEFAPQRQSLILDKGPSQEGIKKWGEFEVATRSGEKRIWDFSTAPLGFDENGHQLVMAMAVDITDRKRTEERLRAARDEATWLARLPGENPNPAVRISTAGIVLYHNPPAAKLPGWTCAVNEPLPVPLLPLLQQAIAQSRVVEQDVLLGERFYTVSVIPIQGESYLNLYGKDITERKQIEEQLQENEQKYSLLFGKSAIPAVLLKLPEFSVVDVNEALERLIGYTRQELCGRVIFELEIGRFDEVVQAIAKLDKQGLLYDHEMRIFTKSGEERIVVANSNLLEFGGQRYIMSTMQDITERRQFEIALRKRESILAQAGEMAHLGAWDIEFRNQDDVNANPLTWSDEVYRIFGYAPGELQPSNELFFEHVHPDDRMLVQESVAQAIATRQPYVIEHRICRPDGEKRIVQERAEVFFDESGKPTRIVGAVQDITERKRAEAALQESERRFRSLADSMPQLVWTALPDGTVDYYNSRSREYWGIKQVGTAVWEGTPVLHPDDLQATVNAWQHSVETGEIYQIEHRIRMADGSYRWHLSRGVPMLDEKGWIVRWFGTATDIHDLKLAEEQSKVYAERLEHSNRELEQFAFMASHDLQEPLRKIEVFGDLLLESSTSLNGRERNYLDRMRNAAGRMRDMVEGLLQLSRVTTQGKPFTRVDLSQVTSEVLSDLESQIRWASGKMDVGTLPVVEGDPLQLRQLMQNLIGNALKYHPPDTPPEVKIYAKQASGRVQVVVEDKGIGFDQEDAERIFQPFLRLVGRSQYEGSGMGLAICRRIVERHGGNVVAFSKPGQGTTFIVTLPIYHLESMGNELRKDANHEDPGATPGR